MLINYLMLLALGVIWGSSFLFLKLALDGFEPLTLGAVRLIIGAIFILSLAFATRQPLPPRRRDWLWICTIGTIASGLAFAVMNTGMQFIESSESGIIITTVPLFTLALAHWFTDDRLTAMKVLGVVVGLIGVMVLFGPTLLAGSAESILGQAFIMITACCYAIGGVITRRTMGGVAPLMAAGWSLAWASLLLTPAAFLFETPLAARPDATAWVGALGAAIFSTGVAIALLFVLIRRAGPNFASMNNYLAPVVSLTWGAIFLAEPITWVKVAALLLLLLGVAIATWRPGVVAQGTASPAAASRSADRPT